MIDLLTAHQTELNALAHRFQQLRTFAAELRGATKRKPFFIRNALAWEAVISARRMLVIDLAAWVDSLHSDEGKWLRKHIQGPTLAGLRNSKRLSRKVAAKAAVIIASSDADPETGTFIREHLASMMFVARGNALERLFGKKAAERGHAIASDVPRLENRLLRWSRNLRASRNVLAHRYPVVSQTVAGLRLPDIAARFEYCGRLMNDLRLLLDNSTYALPRSTREAATARVATSSI